MAHKRKAARGATKIDDADKLLSAMRFEFAGHLDNAKWYKVRNRNYSQWAGREKLLERERASDPEWHQ